MALFDSNDNKTYKNPFKIPDNYFEDFKSKLMEQLPQEGLNAPSEPKPHRNIRTVLLPLLCAAAAFCGIIFGINLYQSSQSNPDTAVAVNTTAAENNEMVKEFCEYSRIQPSDIYAYVTDITE